MHPSLSDIELFVEVARNRSFTRAGEVLDVPASTVSRRVARMEGDLGVRLLNRSTRKVALTQAGAAYFGRCERIIEEARAARELLLDGTRQPQGHLRISLPSSFALLFLQTALREFAQQYPDIECEYDLSVRKIDLQADGFDVVIRASHVADSGIVSHRLGTLLLGLYAAPDYLRAHGVPQRPEDLVEHECLRSSVGREASSWRLYSSHGGMRQVHVRGRIAMNHVLMLRHMAEQGAGIVPLSIHNDAPENRLIRILPDWTFEPIPMVALFPSRLMPARTRAFIDFLAVQMERLGILD